MNADQHYADRRATEREPDPVDEVARTHAIVHVFSGILVALVALLCVIVWVAYA